MNQFKTPILFLFIILLSCTSSKKDIIVNEKVFHWEGWAGNPDDPEEKPYDYFYFKSKAKAAKKAIDKKNADFMQRTCSEIATVLVKHNLIYEILSDFFPRNQTTANPDAKSGGSILFSELIQQIRSVYAKECQPIGVENKDIPLKNWKECECIVYVYYSGGKEAIYNRIREWEQTHD